MGVEDDKRKTRKNIGLGLLALGLGGPLALQGHNIYKLLVAKRLMRAGVLKSTGAVDRYIKKHLATVGKKLPKYEWRTFKDIEASGGRLGIGNVISDAQIEKLNRATRKINENSFIRFAEEPLTSSKTIPVYANGEDVAKGIDLLHRLGKDNRNAVIRRLDKMLRRGGHFDNKAGYVSMGNTGLNPKVLLHELGHAQDAINGKLLEADRKLGFKSLKDWWGGLTNPDSSKLLQTEIRAWNNGGIRAGDEVREAALDTYRSAVRAKALSPLFIPVQAGGTYMYVKNRDPNKR